MRRVLSGLASLSIMLSAGCTGGATEPHDDPRCLLVTQSDWGPQGSTALRAETLVSGLEVPWAIGFLPDGDMLFTERPGRIRLVHAGALTPPVAVITVHEDGEGGLLGLAVDPAFEQNRFFYVYATVAGPDGPENRVERWRLGEDRRHAARDRVLLAGIPAARFHDGGRLRFGPDGFLYVGTGDARQPELAQDPHSLAGKILRIGRDGEIPADNPVRGTPVYVLGVRNAQACDWTDDGALVVADHGPTGEFGLTGLDEVTRARPGSDLGWPLSHGCQGGGRFVAPSIVFQQAAPPGGAVFYRGGEISEWKGSLLVATLGSKHLHRIVFERRDPRRVEHHEVYFLGEPPTGLGRLREVVVGPDGALYVATSNCDGRGLCPPDRDKIYRITRWSPPAARVEPPPVGAIDQ
jgi:glucose/arabinose dehydrogenase